MTDPNEMEQLRDVYYDLYDAVESFVVPSQAVGLLDGEPAAEKVDPLIEELLDDGYTEQEVRCLAALAICDVREDLLFGVEIREAFRDYDES